VWWCSAFTPYGKIIESTGKTTKTAAQEHLTRRIAELQAGTQTALAGRTMVKMLIEDVVRDYKINKKKSLRDVEHRWELHLKPFFENFRAMQVTTDLIERYKDKRIKEGVENGTINRELALLRRGFNLGRRTGKVTRVPAFTMLKEAKPREGFLDEQQYATLAQECAKRGSWLLPFFEVAAQLANRKQELLGLRVRDCDFLAGYLRFPETKNGEVRTVPMTASVKGLLEMACTGKKAPDFVFTRENGKQVKDVRKLWAEACVAAGLGEFFCRRCESAWGEDKCSKCESKYKDRGYRGLKVHDLRRTGIRNMMRRGVPEQIAMRISGHRTQSVFRRYNITNEDDLRAAAKLIEAGRANSNATNTLQPEDENAKEPIKTRVLQ
jgi:integrase